MRKLRIVLVSTLILLVLLNIILFGFIFIVKKQSVEFVSETNIAEAEILKSAEIKSGKPTLLIDKDSAINKIEQNHSYIKVVKIETVSLYEIKIIVRSRYELYYCTLNEKHYILDEDLKVLRITDIEPENLIKVNFDFNSEIDIRESDFIGSKEQKEYLLNLYVAMYSAVISSENEQARIDICSKIKSVELDEDKIIILTSEDVTLDISKPKEKLTNKINLCFSTINQLITNSEEVQGKTIKIFYEPGKADYKCCIYSNPITN